MPFPMSKRLKCFETSTSWFDYATKLEEIISELKAKHSEKLKEMNEILNQRNENTKCWIQAETQTRAYANKLESLLGSKYD